jgi:hypothetical protein
MGTRKKIGLRRAAYGRFRDSVSLESIGWSVFAFSLWAISSAGVLEKFLGHFGAIAAVIAAFLMIPFVREASRYSSLDPTGQIQRRVLLILALLLIGAFIVLFPIAKSGLVGPGSDRDDALNVTLRALLHGHYPYYTLTYLGNPPTPMPGAIFLAAPFVALGTSALQNLFWVPMFIKYAPRIFGSESSAVLYVLIFIFLSPASLLDFVTGGDFLVNCLYIVVAIEFVIRVDSAQRSPATRFMVYVFLSICLSSRPIFIIVVPILSAYLFQRAGSRRAIEFFAATVLTCIVINGPFYLYDPARFPALNLSRKLADFPPNAHAEWLIPALSFVLASSSFFLVMNHARIYGISAASFAVMFLPLDAFRLLGGAAGSMLGGYALPVTIFGGIWLVQMWGADPEFRMRRRRRSSPRAGPHYLF